MIAQLPHLKEIFSAALPMASADRAAYLDQACAGDRQLRRSVEDLIAADAEAGSFLHDPAIAPIAPSVATVEQPGTKVGPYTLLEEIGQGAFGTVFMAEQTAPVRRKVALKILKPGMDTKDVIARFEAERQALAMMDHPGIARVFDAGATENGRPYFAMELVRGIAITDYCDEVGLSIRERLELLIDVCRAVQHAHLKGVIHRDLKPSNVMVTMHDDRAVVKIIDFGIAKALTQPLTDRTLFTGYHQLLGTPMYMSPEQAQMNALDVDTRSDVYSLGVLLYELLTGVTPFDRDTLKGAGFDELRQIIADRVPPRPSARLSTLNDASRSTLAECRQVDQRKISDQLRGELDWIVMKALEKDRTRRYESASDLAEDIRRYLDNEPVLACPPSRSYQLRKLAWRYKGLLTTAGLVLLTAIVGTAVSLSYARSSQTHARKLEQAMSWTQTLLYVSDMKLASDALALNDTQRVNELLQRHVTEPDGLDRRGFEWHYFKKQISAPTSVAIDVGRWVDDVELSPDGAWLAVTATEGCVQIYDTADWRPVQRLSTGTEMVDGLAWSPDGTKLATASTDGRVLVWVFPDFELLSTIQADPEYVPDIAFGPTGITLYTGGSDNVARKWNAETGKLLMEFKGHEQTITDVAVSPNGRLLATASSDRTFGLWDNRTGELRHRMQRKAGGSRITCVAFSPDGSKLAAGNITGDVFLVDVQAGKPHVLFDQADGIESLRFLGSGGWLAIADRGGNLRIVDVPSGVHSDIRRKAPTQSWAAHDGRTLSLTADADGQCLISAGRDGFVRVWSAGPQAALWVVPKTADVDDPTANSVASFATFANHRLYDASNDTFGITVWDLAKQRRDGTLDDRELAWSDLAGSADGRWLAAVTQGLLTLFDLSTGTVVAEWTIDPACRFWSLAISGDGRQIALVDCCLGASVELYQRDKAQPRTVPYDGAIRVALSSDGRWMATLGRENTVALFDLQDDFSMRLLRGHSEGVYAATFSADSARVATIGGDRRLILWEPTTGNMLWSIIAQTDVLRAVAFSPDGRTIATGGKNGGINLWHADTGQPLGSIPHNHSNLNLQFSEDGLRLLARRGGQSMTVYDASPVADAQPFTPPVTPDQRPLTTEN